MTNTKLSKVQRHVALRQQVEDNPFMTDEALSQLFAVSIQTIRLDRLELAIPEYRVRIKSVATQQFEHLQSIAESEIVGELMELSLNKRAMSYLVTTPAMVFERTKIVKGHYIFAQAESLALAVVDAKVGLMGTANSKYLRPAYLGDKLLARATVMRIEDRNYYVHIKINCNDQQVFRAKFKLSSVEEAV